MVKKALASLFLLMAVACGSSAKPSPTAPNGLQGPTGPTGPTLPGNY